MRIECYFKIAWFWLAVTNSAPAEFTLPSDDSLHVRRDIYEIADKAEHRYRTGFFLAAGGLSTAAVAAYLFESPRLDGEQNPYMTLATMLSFGTGLVLYDLGILLMGAGANSLNQAASRIDSHHVDPGGGWGYYLWGLGIKSAGALWVSYELLSHIDVAALLGFPIFYFDVTWKEMALPLITLATGHALQAVAWYRFGVRYKSARKNLRVKLSPAPVLNSTGRLLPGAVLLVEF